jgi:glutamyl-tRNA synthetase
LGNVRTLLINWALARQNGWTIIMRIEDLDRTRVRPGAAERLLDGLAWLGIDFDQGPLYQSHDLEPFIQAMMRLCGERIAYRCDLTRRQIQSAASAPHVDSGEPCFGPELRPRPEGRTEDVFEFAKLDSNYRLVVEPGELAIFDEFAGDSRHSPFNEVGDFLIWTKLGVPAYQLAVVVDDARQGVTDVVRGDDLLPSAARQELVYRALGLPVPRWWHLPLVTAEDGRRLAKRNDDAHLDRCRAAGIAPQRIIGLMASWSGVCEQPGEMTREEFLKRFDIGRVPKSPASFSVADRAWLET